MPVPIRARARLYQTVRTAHLERARQLAPATILHRGTRYDFDPALAADLDLVAAGPLAAAWLLFRSTVTSVEVNEPLMLASLRRTAVALTALRVRALLGGERTRLVSYAIENANPFDRPVTGRARLRRIEHRVLSGYIWRSLDRVVFGTEAARRTYAAAFPGRSWPTDAIMIPAVPAPCGCPADPSAVGPHILFLGRLAPRKGFDLVLRAWPYLKVHIPDARLTVVGTGPLADQARAAAASDPSISLLLDPPRAEIHRQLRRARVLVLPSQPVPGWREQVGLPICEGLAHGCSVVTTTETGLTDWLDAHGHDLILPGGPAESLAAALAAALRRDRSRAAVLADLPGIDGRLAADRWLFDGT